MTEVGLVQEVGLESEVENPWGSNLDNLNDPFGKGYIVELVAASDKGKTDCMVLMSLDLLIFGPYVPEKTICNFDFKVPGVNIVDNEGMRQFLRRMVKESLSGWLVLIDEADGLYYSRGFKDELKTQEILKLNQATKMENYVIWTCHDGSPLDKILRRICQFSLRVDCEFEADTIYVDEINAVDKLGWEREDKRGVALEFYPMSDGYKFYRRQQPIV